MTCGPGPEDARRGGLTPHKARDERHPAAPWRYLSNGQEGGKTRDKSRQLERTIICASQKPSVGFYIHEFLRPTCFFVADAYNCFDSQ